MLLAQFSLYVHKGGLQPDSFHFCLSYKRPWRGPKVVVSTAAFHARIWGSFPGLGGLKEQQMFLPHPLLKLSIAIESSVLDLRPPGFEFRILCMEGSVISS